MWMCFACPVYASLGPTSLPRCPPPLTRSLRLRLLPTFSICLVQSPSRDATRRCRWLSRYALGGSTNGVLHMLALAREAGVDLTIDEFNRIGASVPFVGNLAPSGK